MNQTSIHLTVDTKRSLIRVHKYALHQLNDPAYIQFMIDPKDMYFAVKGLDHASSSDQAHRITEQRLLSDRSIEIRANYFIKRLKSLNKQIIDGNLYRMDGQLVPSERIAVFSIGDLIAVSEEVNTHD